MHSFYAIQSMAYHCDQKKHPLCFAVYLKHSLNSDEIYHSRRLEDVH